ncbi:Palmitoyltransferase PFA5 [Fusarium beomiforme]|uniref:Palmitoyltransferase n=1 Tax=Fusarium beomiforme TaxID=44412 RepID=A0A9P5ADZ8_9HYPO|nr:Palmitoyltransferase PFA5 [Fusarium beomiforme]
MTVPPVDSALPHPVEPGLARPGTPVIAADTASTTTKDEITTRPPSVLSHSFRSIIPAPPAPSIVQSVTSSAWSLAWSNEMPDTATSSRSSTRWIARVLPFMILAIVAYATYDVVVYCGVQYFLQKTGKTAVGIVLIVLYSIFLLLMVTTYIRCYVTIKVNPGFVPWTPQKEAMEKERKQRASNGADVEPPAWAPRDTEPDSPGLEAFYSKDIFICEMDGQPKWCSECANWKPDRAHHSSEYGHCVYKMDHVCPWMGGIISETSFNFFIQFCFYCACFCVVAVAATGYMTSLRLRTGQGIDARLIVGLALGGLFGLFSITMTCTALRFAITNITNIDLYRKSQTFRLAVRVPTDTPSNERFNTITYPLQRHVEEPRAPDAAHTTEMSQANGAASTQAHRMAVRDQQARRTFAILQTEPGENPWHVSYLKNFKSVMGNSIIEWLLPIRHSPCSRHDSMVSDYEFGPLVETLKKRYGLEGMDPEKSAAAMISN